MFELALTLLSISSAKLGPGIDFSLVSIQQGFLMTLPLVALAFFLDLIEKRFQALQDVTTATQRSVLFLLGGTFKPFIGFVTATGLGVSCLIFEKRTDFFLIATALICVVSAVGCWFWRGDAFPGSSAV